MTLRQPPTREGAKSSGMYPADEMIAVILPSASVDGFFIIFI